MVKPIKRNILSLLIITVLYFLYAFIFIKPHTFQNFSLVDDGQVLLQSSDYFKNCVSGDSCQNFFDQTFEFGNSRFRPSYWLINNLNNVFFGLNAVNYHLFRVYIIGYSTVFLLSIILFKNKIKPSVVIIMSLVYMTSISFSENIIRLGTNEPYQILFIEIFLLMYWAVKDIHKTGKKRLFLLMILLFWVLGIKENNIVLPVVILASEFFERRKVIFNKNLLMLTVIPTILLVCGMFLSKYIPSSISLNIPDYTSNYITQISAMFRNTVAMVVVISNSLSPFFKMLFLLFPIVTIFDKKQKLYTNKQFIFWTLFSFASFVILIPWKYVMDRYYLLIIFGLVVVSSFVFNRLYEIFLSEIMKRNSKKIWINFTTKSFVYILILLFMRGLPVNLAKTINYSNWFSEFTKFEGEQVKIIMKYENKVYFNLLENISTWEFTYEIPIHSKYIYNFDYQNKIIEKDRFPIDRYLFSRTPFNLAYSLEELTDYPIVDSSEYTVDQIDPLVFREEFKMRPLHTIYNPPLKDEKIVYYWEIRDVEKK